MFLKDAIIYRIDFLCKENNISLNKLCTRAGITQSTIGNLKTRKNTNVSTLTILRIARGFNMTIDEFFNDAIFKNDEFEDD